MKKQLVIFFLVVSSSLFAQSIKQNDVVGFWKLKESGFFEDGKKVNKDFDNCRLLRNYSIWDNGYAIYSYFEGSNGDCFPSEPRLTNWRLIDNRIQFYINDDVLEEKIVKLNNDNSITLETYRKEKIVDDDKFFEKIANTISYDIIEKIE
ncbi:Lipocalin-like domain-containing protein [Algoriella xinjiangensis]|uniref:Lipocalin-like domain-containing protein n=1 Tax=Algoriella xinjiangensis TaxID=684065 RepID=A0A1I4VMD9_9FLAO|nr:lipocalin family protein [Algoriella xinjiangensis]SFN02421.1 Lipocalin-like domain-containing protein [Algoriella xinjiangensis]VDH17249.1 Uncharacterised protein [Algoriella xinjiangensis]